jgi:hypothetical protein
MTPRTPLSPRKVSGTAAYRALRKAVLRSPFDFISAKGMLDSEKAALKRFEDKE